MLETMKFLLTRAEEMYGRARAEELRSDIEQIAADLQELDAARVEFGDEP